MRTTPQRLKRASKRFRIKVGRGGTLIVLPSALSAAERELIVDLANEQRLPAIYPYRYFITAGGLAFYGVDLLDQYRRAASYVDRILRGEKPGELPVQAPVKFELVVNIKTAKALGLDHSALSPRSRRRVNRMTPAPRRPAWTNDCKKEDIVNHPNRDLIKRAYDAFGRGSDTEVPSFGPRVVCAKCGSRGNKIDVRPNWKEQPTRPTVLRYDEPH